MCSGAEWMSGSDGALAKVKWLWKEEKSAGIVYSTAAPFKGREWVSNLYSAADAKCGLARMLMSPRGPACVCTAKACLLLKSRVLFIEFLNSFFFLFAARHVNYCCRAWQSGSGDFQSQFMTLSQETIEPFIHSLLTCFHLLCGQIRQKWLHIDFYC